MYTKNPNPPPPPPKKKKKKKTQKRPLPRCRPGRLVGSDARRWRRGARCGGSGSWSSFSKVGSCPSEAPPLGFRLQASGFRL